MCNDYNFLLLLCKLITMPQAVKAQPCYFNPYQTVDDTTDVADDTNIIADDTDILDGITDPFDGTSYI